MKRTLPRFEKVPEQPADYVWGAIYASKRFWWLPVCFALVELGLSFFSSFVSLCILAVAVGAVAVSVGLLPEPSVWVWVGLAGGLSCLATTALLIRGSAWGTAWRTFAAEVHGVELAPLSTLEGDVAHGVIGYVLQMFFRIVGAIVFATGVMSVVLWTRVFELSTIDAIVWFSVPMALVVFVSSVLGLVVGLVGTQIPILYFADAVREKATWRRSIVEAFEYVVNNAESVYRLFITSVLLILPALLLMYFSAFMQSLAMEVPALFGVSALVRSVSTVALTVSFGLAMFYFQGASFWLHALVTRRIDAVPTRAPRQAKVFRPIVFAHTDSVFEALLPEEHDNVFELNDVLVGVQLPEFVPLPNADSEE